MDGQEMQAESASLSTNIGREESKKSEGSKNTLELLLIG